MREQTPASPPLLADSPESASFDSGHTLRELTGDFRDMLASADASAGADPESTLQAQAGVLHHLEEEGLTMMEALAKGDYSIDDLRDVLPPFRFSMERFGVGLLGLLSAARSDALQELYAEADPDLLALLASAPPLLQSLEGTQGSAAIEILRALEKTMHAEHGRLVTWRQRGIPPNTLPEAARFAAWNPNFGGAAAASELAHIQDASETASGSLKDRLKLRDAERDILAAVGVPKELSRDFRLSLRSRTLAHDDSKTAFAGIETVTWSYALTDYSYNFDRLTAGKAEALHKKCDIVNLDRYNTEQLLRTHSAIVAEDPETIEKLRSGDVTVVFTDAYDYNGAMEHAPTLFDSEHTLVFEIKQPRDILRHFAQLRRLGIKPATVVMGIHGLEGVLTVSSGLRSQRVITSDMVRHSNAVALIAGECMQPHSATGERLLVLDSCLGNDGGENAMGYVVAKSSKRDQRVAVRAFSGRVFTHRRMPDDGSGFGSKRRSLIKGGRQVMRPAKVVEYRRSRPPLPDRVIISKRTPGKIK